ncbi:MAG: hypothetical protein ABL940_01285 [Bacteroidia bacterium]
MKNLTTLLISIVFLSCIEKKQNKPKVFVNELIGQTTSLTQSEIKKLDSLDIDFQFRGDCYAYSSEKNKIESNGEAHSDNLPKSIDLTCPRQGLYLVINLKELTNIDNSFLGCKLYLVNTSDSLIKLNASDSRLYIVAEALNDKNEWTAVSYLPSSDCGNSYHTVILDKDEYWTFDIPIFKGTTKTKLRYTLTIDKDTKVISNEIIAYLNKGQFEKENKEGHRSNNIMDPYKE